MLLEFSTKINPSTKIKFPKQAKQTVFPSHHVNKHLNCSLHSRLINNSIPDTAACLGKSTCRGSKKAAMVRLIDIRCKVIQVAVIRPSLHS